MRTIDLGNNETVSVGVVKLGEREYLALTPTASRTFRTEAGAIRWLVRRGFKADGKGLDN